MLYYNGHHPYGQYTTISTQHPLHHAHISQLSHILFPQVVENQNILPPDLHILCITGASYCTNPLGSDRFSDRATMNTSGRSSPLHPTKTPHTGLRTTPPDKLGIHNPYAHLHHQNIRLAGNIHIAGRTTLRMTIDKLLPPKF